MKRRAKGKSKVNQKTIDMWNRALVKFAADMNKTGVMKVTVKKAGKR